MFQYFKSIVDNDNAPIVICNSEHKILYMNPSAVKRYNASIIGKPLLNCHNKISVEKINQIVDWFKLNAENNRVHTFYNEKENKDVYMIALRDDSNTLIGYYEKHEYRTKDISDFYEMK